MKKVNLAGATAVAAALAAILLPSPTASANQVGCDDPNFVRVDYHYSTPGKGTPPGGYKDSACFANAGKNWFAGHSGSTSWMDHLHTGNNDITYEDCNGAHVDYPRGTDTNLDGVARCIAWLNIKPY